MTAGGSNLISIDQIEEIFARTVGSIKGSLGMVLWCVAQSFKVHEPLGPQSRLVGISVAWAAVVIFTRLLIRLNRRLLRGRGPWVLDPEKDVVLITGGASGLGLLVAALFSMEGYRTVIFDVNRPQISVARSLYYRVDVGDENDVKNAVQNISEVTPTVLINCAGAVAGSLGPTALIDSKGISNVVQTNLLGPVWTLRALLNSGAPLKMVVAISSSTALVGPAKAGVYAASKAGLRIFMESLRHELPSTRVLCVTPGQLDTAMFKDVATPSNFWAPLCNTSDLAERIFGAVINGDQGELRAPAYTRLLPYVLLLPRSLVDVLRWWIGVDNSVK